MAFLLEPYKYHLLVFAPTAIEYKFMMDNNVSYSMYFLDYVQKFKNLAATWKYDTRIYSFTNQIALNSAYQEIIGMGEKAVPLILSDLKKEPNHWFWALQAITGYDPVKSGQKGQIKKMASAWVDWGTENGYI